ncbi:MAG: type II toxin-antitoxin system VapC family toxin [Elusimicrobiota bacterium]
MVTILDACALMAYLEKEPGYEKVRDLLTEAAKKGKNLLMSVVNWGEVFYVLVKSHGIEETEAIQRLIETLPIDIIPVDVKMTKQSAFYKATKNLPYVDCFAGALAKIYKGGLITVDKDFRLLENEIKIVWL